MDNDKITEIVSKVLKELDGNSIKCSCDKVVCDGEVPDLSAIDFTKVLDVPNPYNAEAYMEMRKDTSARLGVWRAGPRLRTNTYLRMRSDHAAAMDAVFNDVSEEFIAKMNLFSVKTKCNSKNEFLTRPDLGRLFDEETKELIRSKCIANPDVQIIVADGLSSTSIEANVEDVMSAIMQGLKISDLKLGTPIFVKYGRVGAMDSVTDVVKSKVTVILIGERPGLVTGESMSAYMTYGGYIGIPEASRTVLSNIYRKGTNPAEAGAHISDIIKEMIKQKASGLDLKIN